MHMKVALHIAVCVAVIGSNTIATGATRPRVVEATFAEFSVAPPTTDTVFVCYGFGCKYRVEINLTTADRAKLAQLLAAGRSSPAAERRAVAADINSDIENAAAGAAHELCFRLQAIVHAAQGMEGAVE